LRFGRSHAVILVNMFTQIVKPPHPKAGITPGKRGRPKGQTAQGLAAKQRLYDVAIRRMATHGYDTTTLRAVAREAGVSVSLLYRYFPSKQAVIFALYEDLSEDFVREATAMPSGKWRTRSLFALKASLDVLSPHRNTLRGLIPVIVGDPEEGMFGVSAAAMRFRVQGVFQQAVVGAADAPSRPLANAIGRLLYLVHLAVLLWWLLDRTPRQRATTALVSLFEDILPSLALTLRLPFVRRFVTAIDGLFREGLYGDVVEAES
jgi:AcrR family transcriptional regulator